MFLLLISICLVNVEFSLPFASSNTEKQLSESAFLSTSLYTHSRSIMVWFVLSVVYGRLGTVWTRARHCSSGCYFWTVLRSQWYYVIPCIFNRQFCECKKVQNARFDRIFLHVDIFGIYGRKMGTLRPSNMRACGRTVPTKVIRRDDEGMKVLLPYCVIVTLYSF